MSPFLKHFFNSGWCWLADAVEAVQSSSKIDFDVVVLDAWRHYLTISDWVQRQNQHWEIGSILRKISNFLISINLCIHFTSKFLKFLKLCDSSCKHVREHVFVRLRKKYVVHDICNNLIILFHKRSWFSSKFTFICTHCLWARKWFPKFNRSSVIVTAVNV